MAAGVQQVPARASVEVFGRLPTGELVHRIMLRSGAGGAYGASIITLGAAVQELTVPDRGGNPADVVLGFDNLEGYLGRNPCFGAVPGRYANRIAGGRFVLEGQMHQVTPNWTGGKGGKHALHGGASGFDKKVWTIASGPTVDASSASVTLTYHSPDLEEGFPGALDATVTYRWTVTGSLDIDFSATADRPTVVNLTNHSYFNLAGTGDVLQHAVEIKAAGITEVDEEAIPSGRIMGFGGDDGGKRFDQADLFEFPPGESKKIGERIAAIPGGGYDHNYCVAKRNDEPAKVFVARVVEAASGRVMQVWSTQPGVQFFTANGDVVEGIVGKGGAVYPCHAGFCLETQHYPDTPNHDNFPRGVTVAPGHPYRESVVYRFSTQ